MSKSLTEFWKKFKKHEKRYNRKRYMRFRKQPKFMRAYLKNKKRLKELSEYIIEEGRCLLCFTDVRVINKKLNMDFHYANYHRLIVFRNEFYICDDCYIRFKEVTT